MKITSLMVLVMAFFTSFSFANQSVDGMSAEAKRQSFNASMDQGQLFAYNAQNIQLSINERVDALQQLYRYPSQSSLVAIARALKDENKDIRLAAITGVQPYAFDHQWRLLAPLLSDADLSVRRGVGYELSRSYTQLTVQQQNQLNPITDELIHYLSEQTTIENRNKLADLFRWHQQWDKAELQYSIMLKNDQDSPEVWLNYADVYRGQGKDDKSLVVLNQGLQKYANDPQLHYSKSLTLVRLEKREQAMQHMLKAAQIAQSNSYFWYLAGTLQEDFSANLAIQSYEKAYYLSGAPQQLYALCAIYQRHDHKNKDECFVELEQKVPQDVFNKLTLTP